MHDLVIRNANIVDGTGRDAFVGDVAVEGRHVAQALPRPWERNLPSMKQRLISPTLVQRDFARIIRQLGTPAQPPKPRGISPGRRPGLELPKRPRQNVVVKSHNTAKAA